MSRKTNVQICQLFLHIQLFKLRSKEAFLISHCLTPFIETTASLFFSKSSGLYTLFSCFFFFLNAYTISNILSHLKSLGVFGLYLPTLYSPRMVSSPSSVASFLAYFLPLLLEPALFKLFSGVCNLCRPSLIFFGELEPLLVESV